ncbi:MAG: hypothetical protein ACRBC3_17045 [Burkholderiaceae bacterium]
MSTVNAVVSDFEVGESVQQTTAAPKAGKSIWTRFMASMARRAEQQAMARLAAVDPRLMAEIRAARDRAEKASA